MYRMFQDYRMPSESNNNKKNFYDSSLIKKWLKMSPVSFILHLNETLLYFYRVVGIHYNDTSFPIVYVETVVYNQQNRF